MTEELEKAAAEFCKANPSLATSSGSFSKCRAVSGRLKAFLEKQGFEVDVLRLAECSRRYPDAHPKWSKLGSEFWWVHYAVLVGDTVIDCTSRQFDRSGPHPSVRSLAEVRADWDVADRIDPVKGATCASPSPFAP